jgi:hypothetical protein
LAARRRLHFLLEKGFRVSLRFLLDVRFPSPESCSKYALCLGPAGLLEEGGELEIVAHLCLAAKASWDPISCEGVQFDGVPELEELVAALSTVDPNR